MADSIYTVEKLVAGGKGIVRDRAQTIFIPFVIPGERIKIRIEPGTRRPVQASVIEFLSRSPDRVPPPCPWFTTCGGCRLQHIAYPRQLELKQEILAESLFRIARIQPQINPILPSPKTFHYRSRIKLHVQAGRPGFFAEAKESFQAIDYCYLAEAAVNRAIASLAELIRQKRAKAVELILEPDGTLVAAVESGRGMTVYLQREESDAGEPWKMTPGRKVAFQQVNPEQNRALREIIAGLAAEIRPPGVLELFAGSGNLTEVILPHCSWVVAVDADSSAIELAREKFHSYPTGQVKFIELKAEDYLAGAPATKLRPDLVVLDPPRTGAKAALPGLVRLKPKQIIYVSCDPASLARDLKDLLAAGYLLRSLTPLDMFPQTAHIEAVAVLAR